MSEVESHCAILTWHPYLAGNEHWQPNRIHVFLSGRNFMRNTFKRQDFTGSRASAFYLVQLTHLKNCTFFQIFKSSLLFFNSGTERQLLTPLPPGSTCGTQKGQNPGCVTGRVQALWNILRWNRDTTESKGGVGGVPRGTLERSLMGGWWWVGGHRRRISQEWGHTNSSTWRWWKTSTHNHRASALCGLPTWT